MSEEGKRGRSRQLKEGVKLKTKPAVVPKRRKMKTRTSKMPIAAMMPKGITKWNIIFTVIFGTLLILTIVNSYFYTMVRIPLPDIILQFLEPAIMIVEVFIVLLAFEAKAFKFPKIHTRHSVKRILITGFIIGTLLVSFFTPYVNLIGKYRDLPPGTIEPMDVNDNWFNSLFTGSAPFYIDGLLDLLDALDLNDSLDDIDIARVTAEPGSSLGDFLYRWEIRDTYQSDTWEFSASSPTIRTPLEPENYGPPLPDPNITVEEFRVNQTVYTVTTGLLMSMISTWSNNYEKPFLKPDNDGDWDNNIRDSNNITAAVDGSANIRYNVRDMLSVQATTTTLGFTGSLYYNTYFARDENISAIVTSTGDYGNSAFLTSGFNTTYARFLQTPTNYATISPNVAARAASQSRWGTDNGHDYYQQITYILDSILTDFGPPLTADSDNQGQDRAERVVTGVGHSLSGYLALAIMSLRLNNIPCRPVFGFAIGDEASGPDDRLLKLENFYAWIEALIPIDIGGGNYVYQWGQFQMGPYYDGVDLIYADNTLYTSYDLDLYILNEPPLYLPVSNQMAGSELVYVTDYATNYTFRAEVTDASGPVEGVTVTFKTLTLEDYYTYQSNPALLLSESRHIGEVATDATGRAELYTELDPLLYPTYVPTDNSTVFALLAYATFLSLNTTGFIVAPEGYLTDVYITAPKQIMANPYPPPVGVAEFYILQRGSNYTISTNLYEEVTHVTPLVGRLVTYYILDDPQMQAIIADPMALLSITPYGQAVAYTNSTGGSAVATQSAGFDFFENCSVSTTYYIVARYGQNYTVTILLYEDSVKSIIDLSDDFHNKDAEGDTFTTDLDLYLYVEPTGGTPEPLENEALDVWFVPKDVYDAATKTSRTALESDLTADSFAMFLESGLTSVAGTYNSSLIIDVSGSYAGIYYILVFYLDTWNISAEILIADAPALVASVNGFEDLHIGLQIDIISHSTKYYFESIQVQLLLHEVIL